MVHFQVIILFVVAELSCLRHTLVFGERDLDLSSQNADVQRHRTKRFLWGGLGCGLIPGCEKCTDGLICKKCRRAFIPVEYERNKKKIIRCTRLACPDGYNITTRKNYPKICVRTQLGCVARNCDDCHPHNPASCTNCTQGFYSLQKKIMGNVRCVRHCPVGFTPIMRNDGTKLCKDSQSKCQSVVPHCAKCLDSSRCRKCRSNFHAFFNKSGMVCVRHCPKNLFAFNSSYFGKYCKKPLVECKTVAHCSRCPDKINCRRCKPRYFKLKMSAFANSTCVLSCPPGFAKKGRRCQRVTEDGCTDEYCLSCKEGWFRVNYNRKRCQRKCPKGFYIYGKKRKLCLRCVTDCEHCINGYDCIKCNPETSKITQGQRTLCVRSCPFGYTSQGDAKTGKTCLVNRIT